MIADNSQAQKQLASERDRITNLLTRQVGPQSFGQDVGDISQSLLSALSQNTGAAGFQQSYGGIQDKRSEAQGNLYKIMQEQVTQGNEDASHIDKAIRDIVGDDVNAYERIAKDMHDSPEPITRANANLFANRTAAKIGFKPMSYKIQQLQYQEMRDKAEAARQNRKNMQTLGFNSPKAYEKYQEKMAESLATKAISLPKVKAQGEQTLKLIDDIITHPGMTSMVGSRLGFGSINTLLPSWLGGENPIAGTDAANFKAKFDQLQGKQFLEAFETLKGGGAITEVEGQKATKAISDMSLAQDENEFLKSANELKEVVQNAVRRAGGQQVFESGGSSQIPEGTVIRNKAGQTLIARGGQWVNP